MGMGFAFVMAEQRLEALMSRTAQILEIAEYHQEKLEQIYRENDILFNLHRERFEIK